MSNQQARHPPDESSAITATFMFADIAGFTALTEAHGDQEAAKLVGDFCDAVDAELPGFGGTQVKTIGDAVMLHIPDPGKAVLLGLRIAHDVLQGHGAPAVRVGMHHGPAIERGGDYIGSAVNIAARVSAAATGGEVLLTAETAAAAGSPTKTPPTSSARSPALEHSRDTPTVSPTSRRKPRNAW